jgi:hypothetical protein
MALYVCVEQHNAYMSLSKKQLCFEIYASRLAKLWNSQEAR